MHPDGYRDNEKAKMQNVKTSNKNPSGEGRIFL
jgi:hypothetical protein